MWEIFEHLTFLRPMINIHSYKVKESVFYSIASMIIGQVTGFFSYLSETVMGITVAFTLALFIIMIVDYVTGYCASRKEGDKPQSKKGLRWVFKFGSYIVFIYVINALAIDAGERIALPYIMEVFEIIKFYVLLHITYWEVASIDENFERLGYDFRILKLGKKLFFIMKEGAKTTAIKKAGLDEEKLNKKMKEDGSNS